jgi:hypothetical protein
MLIHQLAYILKYTHSLVNAVMKLHWEPTVHFKVNLHLLIQYTAAL